MTEDFRYAGPRELPLVCSARQCAIDTELGEESYACEAEGCTQARLCIGCVWSCNDCSGDFCEAHIEDAHAHEDRADTCYVCRACLGKRQAAAALKKEAA